MFKNPIVAMVTTNMVMIINCIVLNEITMCVVVSNLVCNMFMIIDTAVVVYILVFFMCGIKVVINIDAIIIYSVVGV